MMENRLILKTSELDGFDKRKLPSPGFMVEVVLADINATIPTHTSPETASKTPEETSAANVSSVEESASLPGPNKETDNTDKDDVFSDNEGDTPDRTKTTSSASSQTQEPKQSADETSGLTKAIEKVSISENKGSSQTVTKAEAKEKTNGPGVNASSSSESEFKVMAADASVFSFGDEEDFESD